MLMDDDGEIKGFEVRMA